MGIFVSKSKDIIISGFHSLNKQSARLCFRQCSSEAITSKFENDLSSSIKMEAAIKELQKEFALLKNASANPLKNVEPLQKTLIETVDIKKTVAVFAAVGTGAYWLGSELQDKPSRSDLKEELALFRAEVKEEIRESEKRIIDTLSKDIRFASIETENRLLKSQQNKEAMQ
jgi:hypothetical protein